MERMLGRMLDEGEFLSLFGLRSLSKRHVAGPVTLTHGGDVFEIHFVPGEGDSDAFGGNSNWRGPVWFEVPEAKAPSAGGVTSAFLRVTAAPRRQSGRNGRRRRSRACC